MQNAVTLVVGIVAGLALIVLGVRWAEDRQSKKAPRPTPAEPKNWFRHLELKPQRWLVKWVLTSLPVGLVHSWPGMGRSVPAFSPTNFITSPPHQ